MIEPFRLLSRTHKKQRRLASDKAPKRDQHDSTAHSTKNYIVDCVSRHHGEIARPDHKKISMSANATIMTA
jgi:hypothetical protein